MPPKLPYTHTVVEGDTLPDLSEKIYGDSSYYVQVAAYNNLNKFRNLKTGTTLVFPPLAELT
ncbi:MAG: LysM peptidoglycan-binding domain-containing protein [Bacteroidia bacterium]|nr:LysM peptidoglycan-binding domain-containing protein [Bacteroidia bacterium]